MRQLRSLLPFCLAFFLSALAGPAARAADVTIVINGNSFSPKNVTIHTGDTVTWKNSFYGFHNVVSADAGFSSGEPSEDWTFSHTFQATGSFEFHCEVHRAMGMTGTVTVEAGGGGGNGEPGMLRFAQASYTVSEGAGHATITVSRINGDEGAATVQWAAAAGTATAGSDFTAASGTLSWADGDDDNKSFQVTIANDTADEPNETINLALSTATGAVLDNTRKTAPLTITDNDGGGGGGGTAPAAPANLKADPHSTTEVMLAWTDAANNETGFRIEQRTLAGTYAEVGTVGANTATFVADGLSSGTFYVFRVRAQNSDGNSAFSNEAGAAPDTTPLPCLASATVLCANNNRFQIEVDWRTATASGAGQAVPIAGSPDSGLFYFFDASNLEMLIKVLNGCGLTGHPRYWVFFAATTNVELGVTVTDTQNGQVKSYFNPLNRPVPPVQDTDAFATCP